MNKNLWQIKNVPEETVKMIKQQATEYGATIPQYLAMIHSELKVQSNQKLITWSIQIKQATQNRLKILAGKRRENISDTIDYLLSQSNDTEKIKAEVRAELLAEIEEKLNPI